MSQEKRVATQYAISLECDAGAKANRIIVPLIPEPAFATLMRARVLALRAGAKPEPIERALMRKLLALKPNDFSGCDHLGGTIEVAIIPDVQQEGGHEEHKDDGGERVNVIAGDRQPAGRPGHRPA